MSNLRNAEKLLQLSCRSVVELLARDLETPRQRVLAWVGSELERLAGEAYRLADEAGDDPKTDPCREPIPGFDEE